MKIKNIIYLLAIAGTFCCTSCNDYLDELPDNRAELDSESKIANLLVSAYPVNDYVLCAELSSDNVDDYGENNPHGGRFYEQLFNWEEVKESNNEDPSRIWSACYNAIAVANQALYAIDEMGNPTTLNACKGEALIARAYGHFVLVNMFSQHYTVEHGKTDLGITYMEKAETELNPTYKRNTVAEVYEKIEQDLEAGLPLIDDALYTVPKYHFNKKAAYSLAARFYLYYQKWDKAIECATVALGSNPTSLLRDNVSLADLPRDPLAKVSLQYVSASQKANFLLQTAYSQLGTLFGAYYTGSRFTHGAVIAKSETIQTDAPWGKYVSNKDKTKNTYYLMPWVYGGTNLDKVLLPRIPYLFEYTDAVSQTGYTRAVYAAFTAEETLLVRAEAYIMQKEYAKALNDMNMWVTNTVKNGTALTNETITAWRKGLNYFTPNNPTPIKELHPDFTVEEGEQEAFVQTLLYMRRHETLHMGLRWFDVKRYGIEVTRRVIESGAVSLVTENVLKTRDNRCALQIPADVISAGYEPNPR